jgi:hypothetical protein
MAEITSYKSIPISELMSNLARYKYNPSNMQRLILDHLDEITNGTVDIVDPTNPFVFLLESSTVNTSLAINENVINLRKQYPSLSLTEEEVYLHMSDKDFVNRFAVPASANFVFMVKVNDILQKAVYDTSENCFKLTIPRDTQITVEDLIFTLQYPIEIRRFNNGVVQLTRDAEITSPLQTLTGNIVDYTVRRDLDNTDWIVFNLPVQQFKITSNYFTTQETVTFSQNVVFEDKYYYARVYQRNDNTLNQWVELNTTHTDQVFDSYVPTAVLKVFSNYLNIFIPSIYLTDNLISGDIRIDVYTTKGDITVNLSNYKLVSFGTRLVTINEERDFTPYVKAMTETGHVVFSSETISGGTNGIDFMTLRERVIFNSIGDRQLPVTNVQIEAHVNNQGFDLIKNVDVVTNRLFLATKKLPKPINTKLLTSASIGISTFVTNLGYLKTLETVADNDVRITLLSKNLYLNNNGIIKILTENEINAIKVLPKPAMVSEINSKQYLYTPFYYVLDSSQREFELRAYNLDQPKAKDISFLKQNETLQLIVNTESYKLEKISTGYRLTIVTKSGNFYKQVADNLVNVQLAFYPIGESYLAYINGVLLNKTTDGERIYSFDIETNHDIDSNDRLCITNSKMFNNEDIKTWVNLSSVFNIIHTTSSINNGFIADNTDTLVGKFLLPNGSVGNTHEKITLILGYSLKNLWSRSRTLVSGLEYETYPTDVAMVYTQVVYETDPVTGSIFSVNGSGDLIYNVMHQIGDPVLDVNNQPVFKHRRGDVVLDTNGDPVLLSELKTDKEIDLLHVDGKYYFADDESFIEYKDELSAVINTWITSDIKSIQDILLEQTKIFFYPKTTLGLVKVYPDNITESNIKAEQSFTLDLYVKDKIYKDNNIRQELINDAVTIVDDYIDRMTINITELLLILKERFADTVESIDIRGLGGSNNYQVITLAQEHNRLCLKKKIILQEDNSLIIKEDVTVNFYNVERILEST